MWLYNYTQLGQSSCGTPHVPRNGYVSFHGTEAGTVATFSCYHGYHFPGGGKFRTAICMGDGEWSVTIENCLGICVSSALMLA